MGLTEENDGIEAVFKASNGWIKSEMERGMEANGYKLFCNHTWVSDEELERQIKVEKLLAFGQERGYLDHQIRNGAYSTFASYFGGESFYIKAAGLIIIKDSVVTRDWDTLIDQPYPRDMESVLEYTASMEEAKRAEVRRSIPRMKPFGSGW